MITAVVLSRDRACQLELLLRTLPAVLDPVYVIAHASTGDHKYAYRLLTEETDRAALEWQQEPISRRAEELFCGEGLGCFLTDDSVFYRQPDVPERLEHGVICHSFRLGANTSYCYPLDRPQRQPEFRSVDGALVWDWTGADGDYGYPGSLDGHLFRTSHLRRMLLSAQPEHGPNQLEDHFNRWCRSRLDAEYPLMRSEPRSSLVGVPANRVNTTHPNRHGDTHPADLDQLMEEFVQGRRLTLPPAEIVGAHQELPLWTT